jgi:hypothetical protein
MLNTVFYFCLNEDVFDVGKVLRNPLNLMYYHFVGVWRLTKILNDKVVVGLFQGCEGVADEADSFMGTIVDHSFLRRDVVVG